MNRLKNKIEKVLNKSKNNKVLVFSDTETTGLFSEDRVLQAAYSVFILDDDKNLTKITYREENILPPVSIKPQAAEIHGIWYNDLKDAPSWEFSKSKPELEYLNEIGAYFIAHNALFDFNMLKKEGLEWNKKNVIDTLRISKHLYGNNADVEKYSLQYLRYLFDFDRNGLMDELKTFNRKKIVAHTALSDIIVLIFFFKKILKEMNFEDIVNLSFKPVLIDEIRFGNVFERGTKISDAIFQKYEQYGKDKIGYDYLSWAFNNMDLNFDIKYSIAYFITKGVIENKIGINQNIQKIINFAKIFIKDFDNDLYNLSSNEIESYRKNMIAKLEKRLEKEKEIQKTSEEKSKIEQKLLELDFLKNYLFS